MLTTVTFFGQVAPILLTEIASESGDDDFHGTSQTTRPTLVTAYNLLRLIHCVYFAPFIDTGSIEHRSGYTHAWLESMAEKKSQTPHRGATIKRPQNPLSNGYVQLLYHGSHFSASNNLVRARGQAGNKKFLDQAEGPNNLAHMETLGLPSRVPNNRAVKL
ncbi:hypothetical protein Hypma_012200 [Hypsizygus marmoreus]|uniref:Uncharacterized protein n=1 Tax=Hypsizygus marmoreus TaxID=39966 RepID=A0A369JJU4_HYPMA|nr:hypothetical protein Hypma_012200 [Hypsizygus marmoreus]